MEKPSFLSLSLHTFAFLFGLWKKSRDKLPDQNLDHRVYFDTRLVVSFVYLPGKVVVWAFFDNFCLERGFPLENHIRDFIILADGKVLER